MVRITKKCCGENCEEKKVYLTGDAGCHCHHRHTAVYIAALIIQCPKKGENSC